MNRKNRMAAFSSQASVAFNTYLYFKNLSNTKNADCFQSAVVMRVTQGGVYVMVQKYGLEGMLAIENLSVKYLPERETVIIDSKDIRVFDRVNVFIRADMIEFRRTVSLIYQR